MKTCAWCGRENTDEATHCRECATQFTERPVGAKPPARDWAWVNATCAYIGATFLTLLFYFLSLGPVTRLSATISQTTTTTNGTTFTYQRTVTYPGWVGTVYYPAFALTEDVREGTIAGLYSRYLQWWEPPPTNN